MPGLPMMMHTRSINLIASLDSLRKSLDADAFMVNHRHEGAVVTFRPGDAVVKLASDVIRMPPSVKTALPEAARTLEQAWQRKRRELAGWQPSGGWLIDPRAAVRRTVFSSR